MAEKNKGGRPPKYETAEELQKKIDEYFNIQEASEEKPLITGLCLHLGFCSRQSFYDLEKTEKFSHTIKKARTRIEMSYEESLREDGGTHNIFALKNFGWSDKQEVEHSGKMEINWMEEKTYEDETI